jgi:ABC-type uncharacterized transport system substrate-binding protein
MDHDAATHRSCGRRSVLCSCLALATWCAPARLHAASAELRILTQPPHDASHPIVEALRRRFPSALVSDDARSQSAPGRSVVHLAVGPAALQAALEAELAGPLISAFVSSQAFQRMTAAAAPRRGRPVTAVYAEVAPAAQMQLIRQLYRRRVTVGVLLSPSTRALQPLIERAAQAADLGVAFEMVEPGANPVRSLAALSAASVLLTLPDPELYNPQATRAVLESTYRRRQGVIGFSRAMVGIGTLAAAYTTIDDVVAQLDTMVEAIAAGQPVDPQYPLYWRVAVHDSVARSLDVIVDASVRSLGHFPG